MGQIPLPIINVTTNKMRLADTNLQVAGIIPRAFVPVFKEEWGRLLFLLVSVTTNNMRLADTNI
jgi:hypothetical protein